MSETPPRGEERISKCCLDIITASVTLKILEKKEFPVKGKSRLKNKILLAII